MPVSERTSVSALSSGLPVLRDDSVPVPDTAGEKMISTIVEIKPPYMLHNAQRVLNRRQYSENRIVGRFAAAATANASATKTRHSVQQQGFPARSR
jgi:hypothetical protein